MSEPIYIVQARRLPFAPSRGPKIPPEEGGDGVTNAPGLYGGTGSVEMLAKVLTELARTKGLTPDEIADVLVGCALQDGDQGINVARQALLTTDIPQQVPAATVNRLCGSSLSAAMKAAEMLLAGDRFKARKPEVVLVGGVEHMGRHDMVQAFQTTAFFYDQYAKAHITALNMGLTAENLAERFAITRREQESFAWQSHRKAAAAQASNLFADEIIPVKDAKGRTVSQDLGVRSYRDEAEALEQYAKLKPVFKEGGTVTAATASPYTDGASGLLIATASWAEKKGLKPLAEIIAWGSMGLDPEVMGLGAARAALVALERAGLRLADMDILELNEAFCVQALAAVRELSRQGGLSEGELLARTNPLGGATALGHALGATGAKLLGSLAWQLNRSPAAKYGLVSMCIGLGQGDSLVLKKVS